LTVHVSWRSVKISYYKEPTGRVRYLKDDEADRLMDVLPESIRPLIMTSLMTGMRREELVRLRKSSVDLKGQLITLTLTKN